MTLPSGQDWNPSDGGPAGAARPAASLTVPVAGPAAGPGTATVTAAPPLPGTVVTSWGPGQPWPPRLGPPPPPTVALPPLTGAAPRRLLGTAAAVGAVAALLLVAPRPGLGVLLVALALTAATRAVPGRSLDRTGAALWVLALGLTGVAAVRASEWLVWLCLLVAAVVAALAVTRARTWPGVVLALPALVASAGRALPWAGTVVTRQVRPAGLGSYGRGAALGLATAAVVGGLLASADPTYADLLGRLLPSDVGDLPLRAVAAVTVAVAVLGVGAALAAPARWRPPRPGRPAVHRAEWVLPLAIVAIVLLLWVAVQAARLFGLEDPAVTPAGDTYASRARLGFGQLVVVTLVLLALLSWAARRADARDRGERRLLALLGGAHVLLGEVVVASALQRMWDYDQAYGLTVLRLVVAATEIWLGLVLAGAGLAWLTRRTRVLALAVPVAGAAWLLVLALAGPDALVARWDVDRFARTGRIDVDYLASLSDDAVPAFAALDPATRACVLERRTPVPVDDPWYGWNLARSRAAAVPGVVTADDTGAYVTPRRPPASPCPS